jgi:hypothetical protein
MVLITLGAIIGATPLVGGVIASFAGGWAAYTGVKSLNESKTIKVSNINILGTYMMFR